MIEARNSSTGELVKIEHHSHGHTFKDVDPEEFELPHYHGPRGEHISYLR